MDNFREALVEDEAETAIMESRTTDLKVRMKVIRVEAMSVTLFSQQLAQEFFHQ